MQTRITVLRNTFILAGKLQKCKVGVKCVVPVVYLSPVRTLPTSMCFPRVWCGIGAVHTVWSPYNTKHAKYTHKTSKHY